MRSRTENFPTRRRKNTSLLLITVIACVSCAAQQSADLLATQRLFDAIQLVDWSHARSEDLHDLIEGPLLSSGVEFSQFEVGNPVPADPGVRLVAKQKKCIDIRAWAASLGDPASVSVLLPHAVEIVVDRDLIHSLVTGDEKRFGPVVDAIYSIPGQNNYSLTLLGTDGCFDLIRISKIHSN